MFCILAYRHIPSIRDCLYRWHTNHRLYIFGIVDFHDTVDMSSHRDIFDRFLYLDTIHTRFFRYHHIYNTLLLSYSFYLDHHICNTPLFQNHCIPHNRLFHCKLNIFRILYKTIEIISHTDNLDRPERNRALSAKRAEEVKSYLVMSGLPAKDVIATGKGGDEPMVPNTTPDNRAKNNRIEVLVYSYDAPAAAPAPAPKQNNTQQAASAPKKKCKERDMANAKLGECYSFAEGSKDHRKCMSAYKNLLNMANNKCR